MSVLACPPPPPLPPFPGPPGTPRRGGPDVVVQRALASVARAFQEKPDQVPAPLPALVLRQARAEALVQEQLERAPGGGMLIGEVLRLLGGRVFGGVVSGVVVSCHVIDASRLPLLFP